MEQNKDWWVPNHLHRQKNALVDHYRRIWLRRALCACIKYTNSGSEMPDDSPRSEMLSKQIVVQ